MIPVSSQDLQLKSQLTPSPEKGHETSKMTDDSKQHSGLAKLEDKKQKKRRRVDLQKVNSQEKQRNNPTINSSTSLAEKS